MFHLEGKNKCISYQNFHEVEAEAGRGEGRENLIALEVFFCLFLSICVCFARKGSRIKREACEREDMILTSRSEPRIHLLNE